MTWRPVQRPTRGLVLATLILGGAIPAAWGQASPNLKMGNPSRAAADPADPDNYLLDRADFATSYRNSAGTPNWVSWRLVAADVGRAPRESFYADPDLPAGFLRVDPAEYTDSGFDRGHMCPHEDRSATTASSTATFAMTNVIPQSHDVNTMAWESLEDYCRGLVRAQGKVCYILAGPAGQGGTGKRGPARTTPDGKVVVPGSCWKVVMVLDADVASAADLAAGSAIRLIAVVMPNADGAVAEDWAPFRTTVRQVEALTGLAFFDAVDPAVIGPLKDRVDAGAIRPAGPLARGRVRPARPPEVAAMPTEPPALADLARAVAGLTYPSESDEPFEAFSWGAVAGPLDDARLLELAGQDPRARVERVDPAQFFGRLTRPRHPRGQVGPELARRFAGLERALRDHLTDLEVVKFGRGDVAILVIGRTGDGKVVGVRVAATET